ncbi:universal stress protein [Streptomyces sp. NPDC020858]|uniref:universal stress protein n=1 Tax=Streptomyces sp. NPDC020858 TaxID=3365097 RepID=UPI00379FA2AF
MPCLEETAEELRSVHPGLEITTRRLGGLPAEALARAADASAVLVIGSRGLGGPAGFIVGSVASATIAASQQPVVLVRASTDTSADGAVVALDDRVRPWSDKYPSVGVAGSTPIGQAAVRVLDASHDAGLVVVGRRIRHSAFGTHIGPVAHAVMHHCAAPLAAVAHV